MIIKLDELDQLPRDIFVDGIYFRLSPNERKIVPICHAKRVGLKWIEGKKGSIIHVYLELTDREKLKLLKEKDDENFNLIDCGAFSVVQ